MKVETLKTRVLREGDAPPVQDGRHVLFVIDQFPRSLGGGERALLRLAAELPAYGYRASILTFSAHPEALRSIEAPCPMYLLPITKTYDIEALKAAWALRSFLAEQRVNIVQTFFESSDLWAGAIAKACGTKLIWSRRDMGILRSGKHTRAYRLMRRLPDRVFAVSEQVRGHVIEVDGVGPGRVETIYNGLDLRSWGPRGPRGAQLGGAVITSIGNIRRVKGQDVLVEAAALVRGTFADVSFRLAGEVLEPDYFDLLQKAVTDLNLAEHFAFLGGVRDLRGLLQETDVFVLPSRSEGFSNAIVEAMACGLPVVATDVGGNAEAVLDGVTGFVVPPDDPAALARAIERLVEDPALAERMGAAGRARVAECFTTEAMMQKIAFAYAELTGANPQGVRSV